MESKYITYQGTILRNLTFTATVFREGKLYVAHTPELDVSSCGYSPEEAKHNLLDAVRGFLRAAAEQGTVEQILEEAGFTRKDQEGIAPPEYISTDQLSVKV